MSRKAVIDIGTNSVKFVLAEIGDDRRCSIVSEGSEVVRLGEGLFIGNEISKEAMARACSAVVRFADKAKEDGAEEIIAIGTMALRRAHNAAALRSMLKHSTGLVVRVISGEDEARYSYLAAISGTVGKTGKLAVVDTGGGSTEFIFGEDERIDRCFSLELGAISLTDGFLKEDPVAPRSISCAEEHIADLLCRCEFEGGFQKLIGIGGGITNMAAVLLGLAAYDRETVQGCYLSLEEAERQIRIYLASTIEQRRMIPGLQPNRAETILASALIVKGIMLRLGTDGLLVSNRGLRHGILLDICAGKYRS